MAPATAETGQQTTTTDSTPMESESIVFGEPTMKTAQFGFIMPGTNQAIDLAIREINDSGGLLGSTVLARFDGQVDPVKHLQVAVAGVEVCDYQCDPDVGRCRVVRRTHRQS